MITKQIKYTVCIMKKVF